MHILRCMSLVGCFTIVIPLCNPKIAVIIKHWCHSTGIQFVLLSFMSSVPQTPKSCWLKRPNNSGGTTPLHAGVEELLKSGCGGSSSDKICYGRLCWPCAASWWPGGRSWCVCGRPCWARSWCCCSWCSWGVSWGAGWCPCGSASCSGCNWLSTGCISGMAFPSTVTKTQFYILRAQLVKSNSYQKTNKINTHREPLEGVLLSVISAVPCAQLPVTTEFRVRFS